MMTITRLRLFAAVGVAIGLLGGAATGIYLATAADAPKPAPNQQVKTQDSPLPTPTPEKPTSPAGNGGVADDSGFLKKPLGDLALDAVGNISLDDLFATIENRTEMIVRVDVAAFRRLEFFGGGEGGDAGNFLKGIYGAAAVLPRRANKMPLRDVLEDALAQIQSPLCTYQIRGSQIVIVPAFQPPVKPGVDALNPIPTTGMDEETQILPTKMLWAQIYGGVVSVSADKKPLSDILTDLRKQTGANIVFDPRCDASDKKKAPLTITLNDVRLYDALRVVADMAELKLVYAGNIYYVTTPENAKAFFPSGAAQTPSLMQPKGNNTPLPTTIPKQQ